MRGTTRMSQTLSQTLPPNHSNAWRQPPEKLANLATKLGTYSKIPSRGDMLLFANSVLEACKDHLQSKARVGKHERPP